MRLVWKMYLLSPMKRHKARSSLETAHSASLDFSQHFVRLEPDSKIHYFLQNQFTILPSLNAYWTFWECIQSRKENITYTSTQIHVCIQAKEFNHCFVASYKQMYVFPNHLQSTKFSTGAWNKIRGRYILSSTSVHGNITCSRSK